MGLRSRIVLLAAAGAATRGISRQLGGTIGTASKCQVRYAAARMAGLSEIGDRDADPKIYRQASAAHPGHARPAAAGPGYANWTAPLLARELGDIHEQYIWLRTQHPHV